MSLPDSPSKKSSPSFPINWLLLASPINESLLLVPSTFSKLKISRSVNSKLGIPSIRKLLEKRFTSNVVFESSAERPFIQSESDEVA